MTNRLLLVTFLKLVPKPFISLSLVTLSIFGPFTTIVRSDVVIGRGELPGDYPNPGFNGVAADISTPTGNLASDENSNGLVSISDTFKGTRMSAGVQKKCSSLSSCTYYPASFFKDNNGVAGQYINTSLPLQRDTAYTFWVEYAGSGYWQANFTYQGATKAISRRYLGQTDPMNLVRSGAETNAPGTRRAALGYVDTYFNLYREGGTSTWPGRTHLNC